MGISASGDHKIQHLVGLICSHPDPKGLLAAYLRRPLAHFSFSSGIEQLCRGRFTMAGGPGAIPSDEIIRRAREMLGWLQGENPRLRNPYEVLGVSRSAARAEILQRYRALSKRLHPDRHGQARQEYWTLRQEEVNQAYRTLTDPEARARWMAEVEERKRLLRRLWELEKSYVR